MDNKKIIKRVFDVETGNYTDVYEGDEVKVLRKDQGKIAKKQIYCKKLNNEIREYNDSLGGFVIVLFKYGNILLEEHKEVTPADLTKLFYIATFVNYSGYIIYKKKFVRRKELRKILDLSINAFDTFFNKMIKIGIFEYGENKNIKINQKYFFKGSVDTDIKKYYNYSRLYVDSIRFLYENVKINNHKYMGLFFKILPYVHRQGNILCHNPECDHKEVDYMTAGDLQKLLGFHIDTIRRFINKMLKVKLRNGQSILIFIKNDTNDKNLPVLMNPKIFYGGNFDLPEGYNSIFKWFKPNG